MQTIISVTAALPVVTAALKAAKQEYAAAVEKHQQNLQQFEQLRKEVDQRLDNIYQLLIEQWQHSGSRWKKPDAKMRPEQIHRRIVAHLPLPKHVLQAVKNDPEMEFKATDFHNGPVSLISLKPMPAPLPPSDLRARCNHLTRLSEFLLLAQQQQIEEVVIHESVILDNKLGITGRPCLVFS